MGIPRPTEVFVGTTSERLNVRQRSSRVSGHALQQSNECVRCSHHVNQHHFRQGAIAAAEAEKAEMGAKGQARATQINAEARSLAEITIAKGQAEAEVIRAEASRRAAELLGSSQVAVDLARIDRTGAAIGDRATFFFGEPNLGNAMLANPGIVNTK